MSKALEDIGLIENPEQRCACVLLLDTSGSMSEAPIAALNEGLRVLHDTLSTDSVASRRVEVAIVTFDSAVKVVQNFTTVDQFQPPTLGASGNTSMGAGIEKALDLITERKRAYVAHGITYFRPWIFMITDGARCALFRILGTAGTIRDGRQQHALFSDCPTVRILTRHRQTLMAGALYRGANHPPSPRSLGRVEHRFRRSTTPSPATRSDRPVAPATLSACFWTATRRVP